MFPIQAKLVFSEVTLGVSTTHQSSRMTRNNQTTQTRLPVVVV